MSDVFRQSQFPKAHANFVELRKVPATGQNVFVQSYDKERSVVKQSQTKTFLKETCCCGFRFVQIKPQFTVFLSL